MDNSSFMAKKGLNKNGRKRGTKHRNPNPNSNIKSVSSEKEKKDPDQTETSTTTNNPTDPNPISGYHNQDEYETHETEQPVDSLHSCSICLTDFVPYLAMGVCQHPICNICALRLRCKSKNTTCAICKANLLGMIVYSVRHSDTITNTAAFTALEQFTAKHADNPSPLHMIWQEGKLHFPQCQIDRKNQLIYYNAWNVFHHMEDFQSIHCPFADCSHTKFQNYKQLLGHLHHNFHPSSITTPVVPGNTPPQKTLCQLCLEHRPLFISEQTIYTKKELKAHLSQDHCFCPFCSQHLFDKNLFYQHLQHKHHICHLCDQNMMFRYYKDLPALREHHRQVHYICWQCDHDPAMRGSDISYAYKTLEEYCQHMRDIHSINETSYRKNNSSQGNSLFNLFSFGSGGGNNRSTANDLVFYDLDVGTANPFPNPRAVANASQTTNTTSEADVKESASSQRFPRFDPSRMMLPTAEDAEEVANLIPANMQIAGKVTGTGRFQNLNQEDLSLQQAADLAHKLTYAKMMRNGNVSQEELLANLNRSFPSLQVTNTTNDEADVVFIDRLDNEMTEEGKTGSSTGYFTNLSMKVGGSKATHPLSLVGKKPAASTPTDAAETAVAKEEKEKKVSRALLLAEAFGITDNVSKMSEAFQQQPEEFQIDEYKRYLQSKLVDVRLPLTPSSQSFLLFTLYPMDLMIWGKTNKFELIKIEKKFAQLFTSGSKNHSISLKPMVYHDRQMMHILAKYYNCNSYEYDYEPKRYVSVVKTANSRAPSTLLSDAIAFLPMATPATGSSPATTYTYSLNKLHTTTGIENPIIYFVLQNDALLGAWGKGTDNTLVTKKTSMNASQLFSLLPFNLHGMIVGEFIYYLQQVLYAFDIVIGEVVFSGNCYSVGIKLRDFTVARNAYYYLTMIYEAMQSIIPLSSTTSSTSSKKNVAMAGNDVIFKKLLNKFDHQLLLFLAYYRMTPDFVVNSNTKEEFDQYYNIFQEFIVVTNNEVNEEKSDVEEEEQTVRDAWDDDNTTPVTTTVHTTAPAPVARDSFDRTTVTKAEDNYEKEVETEEDWENVQEWEEYLTQKRSKQPQGTATFTVNTSTSTVAPPAKSGLYQVKKTATAVMPPVIPAAAPNRASPSENSEDEEDESEEEIDEEAAKKEQLDADYALALALAEGDNTSSWQSSSTKSNPPPASKKVVSAVAPTSVSSKVATNRPSNAKPIAVVKNRFNLLNEDDHSDNDSD